MADATRTDGAAPEVRRRIWIPGNGPPVTAVGPGAEFHGLLVLRGPSRIEGRVKGEILSEETLWIGKDARVEATVIAENLVIAGHLEGDVRADGRVALEASAQVTGEVTAQRLVLVEGSQLEGSCNAGGTTNPAAEGGTGSSWNVPRKTSPAEGNNRFD